MILVCVSYLSLICIIYYMKSNGSVWLKGRRMTKERSKRKRLNSNRILIWLKVIFIMLHTFTRIYRHQRRPDSYQRIRLRKRFCFFFWYLGAQLQQLPGIKCNKIKFGKDGMVTKERTKGDGEFLLKSFSCQR